MSAPIPPDSCPALRSRRHIARVPLLLTVLALFVGPCLGTGPGPGSAAAQESLPRGLPVEGGAVEAGLLLRQLSSARRVLVVGAHPDDEDTALLAELDRHRGVRAAYLSLTRGEGGQNLIGPELGTGLGLIRTGELLAARRLDGAEQFFSRAYDFGYSKTAEETFGHWPRDTLLSDVVWAIRVFRPHVVVSVFSGTPADGHGQHQAAGMVAREAFDVAGDPERFPEHMEWGVRPWEPRKLYRRTWRDPEHATLRVATGEYDPLLGRSPFQLAMESRSQHRSQDFGVAQPPGPRFSRLLRLRDRTGSPASAPLFAGIDTSLISLAPGLEGEGARRFGRRIRAYLGAVERARDSLRVLEPSAAAPALEEALAAMRDAIEAASSAVPPEGGGTGTTERSAAVRVLERKAALTSRALLAARGVTARFRADPERWVTGDTVLVHAEVWNGGDGSVRAGPVRLDLPGGWTAETLPADSVPLSSSERSRFYGSTPPVRAGSEPVEVPPGALARWSVRVAVPAGARPTEPYFLARDTVGDLYRWPADGHLRGRPLDPPVASGSVSVRLGSGAPTPASGAAERATILEASGEVRYRGVDKARGEFWRPVFVVPDASVAADPPVVVWPSGRAPASSGASGPSVRVSLRTLAGGELPADVSLEAPGGLRVEPAEVRLSPGGVDERATARFRLSWNPEDGASGGGHDAGAFRTYRLRARARSVGGGAPPGGEGGSSGRAWGRALSVVDYPHIDPVPYYDDAEVRVERFPVEVDRPGPVGYVMGSGDEVPGAIRQLGVPVEMLGPERVRAGDFGGLEVIVLGVRAYEVRDDLKAANGRLLEWVRAGGTLIVQYNKYEFEEGGFAPFPVTMARPHDRVTDERSPVTLRHPGAPALASPNRIGQEDFEGWIQERGLYFLHSWPAAMTPLLAMRDPGEEPKLGSLLVAPLGDGLYVYTGLAFFRQLPAGVPGAYRLFANLLSLEPGEWSRWLEGRP